MTDVSIICYGGRSFILCQLLLSFEKTSHTIGPLAMQNLFNLGVNLWKRCQKTQEDIKIA